MLNYQLFEPESEPGISTVSESDPKQIQNQIPIRHRFRTDAWFRFRSNIYFQNSERPACQPPKSCYAFRL